MSEDGGYNLNSVMNCVILSKSLKRLSLLFLQNSEFVLDNLLYHFQFKKMYVFFTFTIQKPYFRSRKQLDSTRHRKATPNPSATKVPTEVSSQGFFYVLADLNKREQRHSDFAKEIVRDFHNLSIALVGTII